MKFLALGAVALLALVGCGTGSMSHESRSFDVPEGTLVIDTNADLEVRPTDRDSIEVERWLPRDGSWSMEGNTLELRVDDGPFNFAVDGHGRFAVGVPEGVDVQLVSSNGDLDVADLEGDVDVESANGDIELRGLTGAVTASSNNGDVRLDGSTPFAGATLDSSNGDVNVQLSPDRSYRIETDTQNGDMDVDVESHSDGQPLTVTTNNGDITISGA